MRPCHGVAVATEETDKSEKERPLLPAEGAAFGEAGLAAGGLAQDLRAAGADDDGLRVREDGRDGVAAGALDVHEEGARCRHERLYKLGVVSAVLFLLGSNVHVGCWRSGVLMCLFVTREEYSKVQDEVFR